MENTPYRCKACGFEGDGMHTHCPRCLASRHGVEEDGYECGGTLSPISIWVKEDATWHILYRCNRCGEILDDPVKEGDNPLKLLSLASGPLANPPFPIEKLRDLQQQMGGIGDLGGNNL